MNRLAFNLAAVAAAVLASSAAQAALLYDQNVTSNAIYGDGNPNGNFTVETSNGIEIGLRAKERFGLVTGSNGAGSYNQATGFSSGTRAKWNFDWSINTGTASVGAYTYQLGIDYDAGVGTNFKTFDLINGAAYFDHSFGNNGTAAGAGVEAVDAVGYAALKAANNLVQNSWNLDFFDDLSFPFDANADGKYTIYLQAMGATGATLARSQIDVIVGAGAVPEPGSLALAGVALLGLVGSRRRR